MELDVYKRQKLYREEVVDTKSGKTARVSGMRVRVYSRGSTLTVRALDAVSYTHLDVYKRQGMISS